VSGGLVALVSGLLAIAAGGPKATVPAGSVWIIAAALVALVACTICALVVNVPGEVTASNVTSLRELVKNDWHDTGWDQQVASLLVDYLKSLRINNAHNARWLIASIAFQIAGIALIAVSAVLILVSVH
jgi:hypothetical protein